MRVLPGVDASKVKVTGPGVGNATPASLPTSFAIDTREAGTADLEVFVQVGANLLIYTCLHSYTMFY